MKAAGGQCLLNGGVKNVGSGRRNKSTGEAGRNKWKSKDFTANVSFTRRR